MFAPVTPTFAARNCGRNRARTTDRMLDGSGTIGSPYASESMRAIRSDVMWIAGNTRWDGFSPATLQRSSPRSVSIARIPSAARPWFISTSSEVRDFDLTRNSAPLARHTSSTYWTACRPVAAKKTRPPFARTASANASAIEGSWAAVSLINRTRSRNAGRSRPVFSIVAARFARPRSIASQSFPTRAGSSMDRRTSIANRRRPLSRCLPPFEPFEEDHMEGMGPMDSIEEAELDVPRPARPRNECDRGSLSRSARSENASDDRHRRADVSDQPPGGEQDDVHDRQGRGEPRGVIVSHLDDRSVLRNGELRPSHSDLRGGARGQDLRRRKVLQELDGSTLQSSGDHGPKLERVVALAMPRLRFHELRRPGRRMAFRLDGFQGPSEERRGQDRDQDEDDDNHGKQGIPDHSRRQGGEGHDQADLAAGRHAPADRHGFADGHLREAGREATTDDLRDDGEDGQDDRERDQAELSRHRGEVHLEAEGHEKDRREDRRERSGCFREIVLEGRVREHASREECADNCGQSERLRREGEEERNRHRDEEAAQGDPQRLPFDVDSCDDPAK